MVSWTVGYCAVSKIDSKISPAAEAHRLAALSGECGGMATLQRWSPWGGSSLQRSRHLGLSNLPRVQRWARSALCNGKIGRHRSIPICATRAMEAVCDRAEYRTRQTPYAIRWAVWQEDPKRRSKLLGHIFRQIAEVVELH